MKKTKKNYVIIALVVILLALAVGYAAFGGTLQITGTATANGTWNVHFANATITPNESSNSGNTVTLSKTATDNDTLTVTVALGYPGDGATVAVDILNEGTVDARLTEFKVEGTGFDAGTVSGSNTVYQNGAIKVTVPTMNADETTGEVVAKANGKCSVAFDVEWDEDVDTVADGGQTATFTITFKYTQSTSTFTPGASHT